jgi:hypothetical protein
LFPRNRKPFGFGGEPPESIGRSEETPNKRFSPASMDCFARNSALRAALDPATDDLLFDNCNQAMWRAGRIAARQPRIHCASAHRHLSLVPALVWVDFASMLRMVLRLRGAEKSEKSSKISRVTLSPMESEFLFFLF